MSALSARNLQDFCHIHNYKKRSSFNPLLGFHINNIARKHYIDLVHVHDSHALNYAITASLVGPGIPIVLSRRTDFIPKTRKKYNYSEIKAIICVSDHVKKVMSEVVTREEIFRVIHDGIDLNNHISKDNGLKKKYGIPKEAVVIANTSALADHKDYATFVRTANELIKNHQRDYHFFIIGEDAGSKSTIIKTIKELNLDEHISLTGFIPDAQKLLSDVDLFLFTSKEEGFGSTLLEAMKYEVPIVSTNVGGTSDFLVDKENCLICPKKDPVCLASSINKVLSDKDLEKRLIYGGIETIKRFSTKVMAEKTLIVYQQVLNNLVE